MSRKPDSPVIVALGASAGGLRAFEMFFKACPTDTGLSYVVVPHLDPRRQSLMAGLIGKYTRMPVQVITDGLRVEPNQVYVIPPNSFLSLSSGALNLHQPIGPNGTRMAIDSFFRSLAQANGPRAVGIVLSGTGSDGTLGIKAIKDSGGLSMAQDPESAEHSGMPGSAIASGEVDFVLSPERMPEAVTRYVQHHYVSGGDAPAPSSTQDTPDVDKALAIIHARTGRDFRHYKRGTIGRRLQRRMGLHQVQELPDYLGLLRRDSDEVLRLVDDLLIGVTQFYRDASAFEALEAGPIEQLVSDSRGRALRVWVPGCSTGEEAYSLAISFLEMAARCGRHIDLQVFATDVDERVLAVARNGLYPESIAADVPSDRLHRYFSKEENHYRVNKHVRELVVFAPQDLIQDAPFSKLDLVSCRNLLIYLEAAVQAKVFNLLSFALNPGGYLFLGSSESVSQGENLFEVVNKALRLYRKSGTPREVRMPFPIVARSQGDAAPRMAGEGEGNGLSNRPIELIRNILLDEVAPPTVVVTADFKLVYSSGRVSDYLSFPRGEPTTDVLRIARRGLRVKLRRVIRSALSEGIAVSEQARLPGLDEEGVRMEARPLQHARLQSMLCLVSFHPGTASPTPRKRGRPARESEAEADESLILQLENELRATREELQGTIEELESSNEELKTSNEEAMSMNEELQSANEELETSKEELQTLNEEVSTVNSELQEKLHLLERTNADLNNLLASTEIATLFLNPDAVIQRFTPSAQRLFKLRPGDIGRPIQDITHQLRDRLDIPQEVHEASTRLRTIEGEVQADDGCWYVRRVAPYRTTENRVTGAVVTFTDITRVKQAEAALRESESRYRSLYDDNPSIYLTLDGEHRIASVNQYGERLLGIARGELNGRFFPELCHPAQAIREALAAALDDSGSEQRWEAKMRLSAESELWTRGVARLARRDPTHSELLVSLHDITAEKRLTDSVFFYSTHDYLTGLINRREFDRILHRVCSREDARAIPNALIYIDLSNFKLINDTAGHAAGDEALRVVGDVLCRGRFRRRDVVSRLGGDEFAVILEYCTVDEALRVAEEIHADLAATNFRWEEHSFALSCCIGIVPVVGNEVQAEDALRSADAACYEAKRLGPGSIQTIDVG